MKPYRELVVRIVIGPEKKKIASMVDCREKPPLGMWIRKTGDVWKLSAKQ